MTGIAGENMSITATYFSRRADNLIVAVPISGRLLSGQQTPNESTRRASRWCRVCTVFPGLGLSGNFTWIDETHVSHFSDHRSPCESPSAQPGCFGTYVMASVISLPTRQRPVLPTFSLVTVTTSIPGCAIGNHVGYHRFDLVVSI